MTDRNERLAEARLKAMRAARAVTLGAMVGLGGCASTHGPVGDAGMDGTVDGARDSMVADTGCDPADLNPTTEVCCDAAGGFWDPSTSSCAVAVPGPFTPPAMDA